MNKPLSFMARCMNNPNRKTKQAETERDRGTKESRADGATSTKCIESKTLFAEETEMAPLDIDNRFLVVAHKSMEQYFDMWLICKRATCMNR